MRRRLAIAVLAAAAITAVAAALTKAPFIPTIQPVEALSTPPEAPKPSTPSEAPSPPPVQPSAPPAFPIYPGSRVLEYFSEPADGGRMILAVYEARADAKTVASWYKNSLEGWVKAVEEEGEEGLTLIYVKGEAILHLTLTPAEGGVTVEAVYQEG